MPAEQPPEESEPEVIVDFVFEDGLLFVTVRNIGERPAYRVATTFDKPFSGLGGTTETSSLALFRNIEFLAPGKEIRVFLDTSASYFARREPTKLAAEVRWRAADGRRHAHRIKHDLAIYRELTYIPRKEPRDAADADPV